MRAGFPTTIALGGTSRVTTAPAPTIAAVPIVTPGRIVAFAPIDAPSATRVVGTVGVVLLAARELVVGEGRVGADEDVVAHPQAVPQLDAALDGHPIADDDVVLDEDAVADVAVAPDAARRASTWANAQIRVPAPTSELSQIPCGCTK